MADVFTDPTAAGSVFPDPTAPVYIAPMALPEPDPVYRDDALFASAGGNWRAVPVPPPPVPVLDESGRLTLIEPSAADLRDQAVAALHAPRGAVSGGAVSGGAASRGGGRSTYTAPPPTSGSRRPPPARPPGSVTTSPATWLPNLGGSTPSAPNPTVAWQPSPPPPTWSPSAPTAPGGRGRGGPGQVTYRGQGRSSRPGRTGGSGRRSSKGWIPGVIVLLIVVGANVVPHLHSPFHHGVPAGVDQAVTSYYTFAENHDAGGAAATICTSLRADWITGATASTSDVNREIGSNTIASTSKDGNGRYTVHVRLGISTGGSGATTATVSVVKEAGTYRLCGGTNP